MIIAFYGLPRSGKDTAADHLERKRNLHRVSFAAGIYDEVAKAFGVTKEQLYSNEWKTTAQDDLALENCRDDDFTGKALLHSDYPGGTYHDQMSVARTSRFILQRWATEYRRAKDPLYWVKKLDENLKHKIAKEGIRDIVVPDLREPHEYQYLQNLSSELFVPLRVIEVRRAGCESNGHSSDNALPQWCIDRVIFNTNINEFREDIERAVSLMEAGFSRR